jgi:peptidyl-prolyl cis-trans isomerase C
MSEATVEVTMSEVVVNGVAVDAGAHPSPEAAAAHELLRQRAVRLGLADETADKDALDQAIEKLLEGEVAEPVPGHEECRRYYEAHLQEFTSDEIAFARHILFQVTPGVPVPALRAKAELMLADLMRDPSRFEELAREFSNCPSGAHGGNLGQLSRGGCVPEFERALFNGTYVGVYPQLVNTRFGFHILVVDRRESGRLIPFEMAHEQIAARLAEGVQRTTLAQYVARLAIASEIRGADLSCLDWPK